MKSTNQCLVHEIKLKEHPNAINLSIVYIDGYTVIVRTNDWKSTNQAIWIPPENICDLSRPEFKFLDDGSGKTHHRIKCRKLRGVVSYGLLVPAPSNLRIGDDAAQQLGITHYDPEEKMSTSGQNVRAPVHFSKYDVDAFLKYHKLFVEGERVIITEKVNGANCRIVYKDGEIYVGSRNFWKKDEPNSLFWKAFRYQESIESFVRDNPSAILFGEALGEVKGFKYGCTSERKFLGFDIWMNGRWLDWDEIVSKAYSVPWVPTLYDGPYTLELAKSFCEGDAYVGGHIREGCVIQPAINRVDEKWGRVKYKIINPEYLEKN